MRIDDLDRCSPEQVVHALEVVHLLLSLDLFVVIVAVDSRWLIRSLETHYRDVLGGNADDNSATRRSNALNYLEKIFQITFALPPMQEQFGQYIAALTSSPADEETSEEAQINQTKPALEVPEAEIAASASKPADSLVPSTFEEARVPSQLVPLVAPPTAIKFSAHEASVMGELAPLLRTPRVAKRMVNVYRLLKAERPLEVAERSHQAALLLLLGYLLGCPEPAARLLREIHERGSSFGTDGTLLATALDQSTEPKTPASRCLLSLAMQYGLTIAQCRFVPGLIAPYSLTTGHEWHAWDPGARSVKPQVTGPVQHKAPSADGHAKLNQKKADAATESA